MSPSFTEVFELLKKTRGGNIYRNLDIYPPAPAPRWLKFNILTQDDRVICLFICLFHTLDSRHAQAPEQSSVLTWYINAFVMLFYMLSSASRRGASRRPARHSDTLYISVFLFSGATKNIEGLHVEDIYDRIFLHSGLYPLCYVHTVVLREMPHLNIIVRSQSKLIHER